MTFAMWRLPRTLEARFLLTALVGVMLPLAIVGVWLTKSAERSGRSLLRGQLAVAVDALAATVGRRWDLRAGELRLLANNDAARRLLTARSINSEDSLYLGELAKELASRFTTIGYLDTAGATRWARRDAASRGPTQSGIDTPSTVQLEEPVKENGKRVGQALVSMRISSIVPMDSLRLLPANAVVMVRNRHGLIWSTPQAQDPQSIAVSPDWEVQTRTIDVGGLTVSIAAPVAPFVEPFEQASRTGLGLLAIVVLSVVVGLGVLTSRMTRSLSQLTSAATAVAAGRLDVNVVAKSDDDIGQLAAAFNRMTENLRRTLAELADQRALAAVGEFAASLSHEVRNSLTAVRVDLQHANRIVDANHAASPLLTRALDSVRRLDASVTTALRVAPGARPPRETVSLTAILEEAIDASRGVFAERGVTLDPIQNHTDALLLGDADALKQVFLNLLTNAAEATQANGHANVCIEQLAKTIVVKISDTGTGFDSDRSSAGVRLFHTTKARGTGLGLPIARRITESHGGSLHVESSATGATVTVTLPLGLST